MSIRPNYLSETNSSHAQVLSHDLHWKNKTYKLKSSIEMQRNEQKINSAVLIFLDFDTDFYFIGMLFLDLPRMADT